MVGLDARRGCVLKMPFAARYAQILRKRVAHACGRGPLAVPQRSPLLWIIRTKGSFVMNSAPQIESVDISDAELDNISGGAVAGPLTVGPPGSSAIGYYGADVVYDADALANGLLVPVNR